MPGLGDKSRLDAPSFFQVWDKNSDRGGGGAAAGSVAETVAVKVARRVDLVVWHITSHTLELPVDEDLTTANVADALGRKFALNFAMVTLLEAVNDQCYRQRSDSDDDHEVVSGGDRDGIVREFFVRFEANVQALMEEARSASRSVSAPPPNFSRPVEDRLRMALASVRRRHLNQEESRRSSSLKENLSAASDAASSAAGGPAATPGAMTHSLDAGFRHHGAPFTANAPTTPSATLVLRPMEDLFRVFSDVELMTVFERTTGGCLPRGCYEMWFEKKKIVRTGVAFRHEYVMKTGHWYGG